MHVTGQLLGGAKRQAELDEAREERDRKEGLPDTDQARSMIEPPV